MSGGHLGYAWGNSNWTTAPGLAGSLDMFQPFDVFKGTGSFFAGLQAGYNYMLPNRFVIGAEADASFPSFQNPSGISVGGISTFSSPVGAESYSETVLSSGTLRGRIGYAPGNWLLYATGGFAWTYDQLTLTQLATGTTDMPFLWRLGWAAGRRRRGAGGAALDRAASNICTPITAPQCVVRERRAAVQFGFVAARVARRLELSIRQRRNGGKRALRRHRTRTSSTFTVRPHSHGRGILRSDRPIRAPIVCPAVARVARPGTRRCMPAFACGKGLSYGSTRKSIRGLGSATRLGSRDTRAVKPTRSDSAYPYARLQRAFIRQTIDLGGDDQKVDAGINQFAGSQTADRLVITVGKFSVADIFDNNKYAHDPRRRFLELGDHRHRNVRLRRRALGLYAWCRRRVVPG